MPDLGYDIKEFQVFHWKLLGWKRLDKELTSSEFNCGGHKWYVLSCCCRHFHSHNPENCSGAYFSSRSEIRRLLQMTPSLCISLAQAQRERVGTHAPNLCWSYRTLTILPFISLEVRGSQLKTFSPNSLNTLYLRRTTPVHRRRS